MSHCPPQKTLNTSIWTAREGMHYVCPPTNEISRTKHASWNIKRWRITSRCGPIHYFGTSFAGRHQSNWWGVYHYICFCKMEGMSNLNLALIFIISPVHARLNRAKLQKKKWTPFSSSHESQEFVSLHLPNTSATLRRTKTLSNLALLLAYPQIWKYLGGQR